MRQGDTLIASVQEELSDSEILEMQSRILAEISRKTTRYAIIDVSLVDVVDSFGTRTLTEIATAVELRGARMAIVGIQPDVAMSMVLLGLTLRNVPTALDLDDGLALLKRAS